MSIKYLLSYIEICTVLGVEPSFKGLERYESYKANEESIIKDRVY